MTMRNTASQNSGRKSKTKIIGKLILFGFLILKKWVGPLLDYILYKVFTCPRILNLLQIWLKSKFRSVFMSKIHAYTFITNF